jgi:hypothetical protein
MDFKFGRIAPPESAIGPRMKFSQYANAVPDPPARCDYRAKAESTLSLIYCNNQYGCCVISGMSHETDLFMGNAGLTPIRFTDQQIIAEYARIGGFDPNAQLVPGPNGQMINPTDRGCDEVAALNDWVRGGFPKGGSKIHGWIPVDPSDRRGICQAMWLFGGLFFGVSMPDAWVNPCPQQSGFVWDVAGDPNPANGHCIVGTGFDEDGVQIDTWGLKGTITWQAIQTYAGSQAQGALYTLFSPLWINQASQRAANGLALRQLVEDFNAMGGKLELPPDVVEALDFAGIV